MQIDLSKIKLISATLEDYPVIQNMGRFYVYDMSEFCGFNPDWEMPADGLYECLDFKKYWQEENNYPFLIRYEQELVGFVIVNEQGSDDSVDFNIAQFFILRKFKNKGIGKFVAHQCFEKFEGLWEVMVIPENKGAYQFWKNSIGQFTGGKFEESHKEVAHFNAAKDIFRFTT